MQIYTGLDLSRNRLDWHALSVDGRLVDAGAVPPDVDGLAQLVSRLGDVRVLAVIEVMNGDASCTTSSSFAAGTCVWPIRSARGRLLRWRVRPTGSTLGCWPSSLAVT
jgi:hypothetical protein